MNASLIHDGSPSSRKIVAKKNVPTLTKAMLTPWTKKMQSGTLYIVSQNVWCTLNAINAYNEVTKREVITECTSIKTEAISSSSRNQAMDCQIPRMEEIKYPMKMAMARRRVCGLLDEFLWVNVWCVRNEPMINAHWRMVMMICERPNINS